MASSKNSPYRIQSELVTRLSDLIESKCTYQWLRETSRDIIERSVPKSITKYEKHGLHKFADGIIEYQMRKCYHTPMFYLCKDNQWRCKGYYTYDNQPELPTCTTNVLVSVYPSTDIKKYIWSINQEELDKCDQIHIATGIMVFEVLHGTITKLDGTKLYIPRTITFHPDMTRKII